ncbi:type 4a pilus biogenesis protein PilO [Fodinibius halophilus]|uniref:Type 4a pilus biogenesis protein PilO n=1 Tax=Fodinibius halophilus TaxID=1736908 RepID=A0A6M1T1W9_9BACT|nr:type 4a pilus biogenesis protein PilO [Fodinibius halophilus]NGP87989.1 type 4a pilus biogenesis protein PilO [Fodinibius halophilus]
MSYGVRNTLILLFVLTAFIGGGWGYIYFYQKPQIKELKKDVQETRQELNNKQQTADQYPLLQEQFKEAKSFFNNYNKALYPSSNEDLVYEFLTNVGRGSAYTDFSFSFIDSTEYGQYGTIKMVITGEGYYRNLNNFIRQIELSRPLNKVSGVKVNPINDLESYGKVDFNFTLTSFYDRVKLLGEPDLAIKNNLLGSVHNPFFPLIRTVKHNDDNLVNVESSSLVAISSDQVFMIDQNGVMKKLSIGDDVYLGELTKINVNKGSATFRLNKGGIIDQLTLQVNKDENESSN